MAKKLKSRYIQIAKSKYPFGGLINQGLQGIAGAFGADQNTQKIIGDVGSAATGFIPGFQDNFLQAGNLVGDIGTATKDKNLQKAGQIVQPATAIASNFMPTGGTIQQPTNNISMYYQRGIKTPKGFDVQYYKTAQPYTPGQTHSTTTGYAEASSLGSNSQIIKPDEFFNAAKQTPTQIGYGPMSGDLKTDTTKRYFSPEEIKTFEKGGMINKDDKNYNAQLEKKEVFESPDGSVEQVDAPSHTNGGINLNLEQGTRVYSDRLKSSNGKTFAKEAESFKTDKFEKTLKDKNADELKRKTAQLMLDKNKRNLDKIFEEQESQKDDNFASDVFAFGGTMMYKDGGIHIKKENRGKFTSAAKKAGHSVQEYASKILAHKENYSSTLVKRANFARNASKWKHAEGGTIDVNRIPEYFPNGGTSKQAFLDRAMDNQIKVAYFDEGGKFNPLLAGSEDIMTPQAPGTFGSGVTSNSTAMPSNTQSGFNWGKLGTETAIGALGNLGPAAYLAEQGKKYDKQNMYNYTPQTLDPTNALRDIDQSTSANRHEIPGMTGGSGSLAINALLANKLQGDTSKADIRAKYDEANIGISNQGQQFNIGNRYRTDDITAANKGQALTNNYQALGMVGRNVAQQGRDIQTYGSQEKTDQMRMKTLDDLYSNYTFDKNSGHWIPRIK